MPLALRADQLQDQASRIGVAIGRLRPGVGIAAAQAELAAICGQLERLHPRVKGWTARLEPLSEQLVGDLRCGCWVHDAPRTAGRTFLPISSTP